jgi:ABC-type sugar transport system ATPase subunit
VNTIELHGIYKSFGANVVLNNVSLCLRQGKVHVVLGENGAGKSTLMRILCGEHQASAGDIVINGRLARIRSPRDAQRLGIVMIHQELQLLNALSVTQNIFLGKEIRRGGWLDHQAMRTQTQALLTELSCGLHPDMRVGELSIAQKQMLEIARALHGKARVLVMDEPTAALSYHEVQILFAVIRKLKKQNVAVVYISHHLQEIFTVGDSVTVMRDGVVVATQDIKDTHQEELVSLMIGKQLREFMPKVHASHGQIILEVANLQTADLQPTHFYVRAGEILGIAGLIGSGRTTLAEALFGINAPKGQLTVGNKTLSKITPAHCARAGIGLVPEDRREQGLILQRSVAENIALTAPHLSKLDLSALAQRLGLRALHQPVRELSGGNQQKVVLAKWIAAGCKVLILDEPTRGIDVQAKSEIYQCLAELVQQGVAIILFSSDLTEILGLADHIGVMRDGRLQNIQDVQRTSLQEILRCMVGADPESAHQVS